MKKELVEWGVRKLTQKVDMWEFLWYVNVVYGEKGTWKTYYFVKCAYEAYLDWYTIISNVWLDFPHVRFTNTKSLIPIMQEIALYTHYEKWPMDAPRNFLKAYKMKKKDGIPKKYYILFDEIGIHLNHRNWSKNFKDELLIDMIMEPRKYNMTMVGICQDVSTVDIEFLKMATRFFSVRKWWRWIFESVFINWYKVKGGIMDEYSFQNNFYSKRYFHWLQKKYDLSEFRWWLYYTGEVSGAWTKFYANIPNSYFEGCIYSGPDSPLLLKDTAPVMSIANMGESDSSGVSPTNNFITRNLSDIWSSEISSEPKKDVGEKPWKRKSSRRKHNSHSLEVTVPIEKQDETIDTSSNS